MIVEDPLDRDLLAMTESLYSVIPSFGGENTERFSRFHALLWLTTEPNEVRGPEGKANRVRLGPKAPRRSRLGTTKIILHLFELYSILDKYVCVFLRAFKSLLVVMLS